ncbi:hypothetical protein ACFRAR_04545 [Kitasatospora sp. NPDC056651]|uniref:hypothetical protein n=1 Tax=Kitasatospora sp. NPDC056651 TaxID=3345892 RepID=UPI0036A18CE0
MINGTVSLDSTVLPGATIIGDLGALTDISQCSKGLSSIDAAEFVMDFSTL